ncbi:MAG TPA: hypothetical protein VG267_10200 [Terracidiphilus sp.]|jgi:hypothetical protein|nr:hypothetical protein [Terracidiphilus sp.]
MSVFEAWGGLIRDGWGRFRRAWGWVVGEYVGLAVLIALGLLWTRVPEKYGWQVALTLGLPVVVAAGFLWLQAGLIRCFLPPAVGMEEAEEDEEDEEQRWTPIALGAVTLLLWIAIGWVLWGLIDRLDDHIFSWAGYLNSKFGATARVRWASYANLSRDLQWAEWALRWVIVPGLLIPLGVGSAAWGLLRLPWRRAAGLWLSLTWWLVVVAWALIGEWWPQTWYAADPQGTVHAQMWHVGLKLAAAYLLAVTGLVKVLCWGAMLVNPRPRNPMDEPVLSLGLSGGRSVGGDEAAEPVRDEDGPDRRRAERRPGGFLSLGLSEEPAEGGIPALGPLREEASPAEEVGRAEVKPAEAAPGGGFVEEPPKAVPAEPEHEDGVVGRPLPRGGEDGGGNA